MAEAEDTQKIAAEVAGLINQGEHMLDEGDYIAAEQLFDQARSTALHARALQDWLRIDRGLAVARELLDRQKEVGDLLASVAATRPDERLTLQSALDRIGALLVSTPREPAYDQMRSAIEQARDQLEHQLDDRSRYERALAAIWSADYIGALRLFRLVDEHSPFADEARYYEDEAQAAIDLLLPMIDRVSVAPKQHQWEALLRELENAEPKLANNPELQQLLITIGVREIHQGLRAVQQLSDSQDYTNARQVLEGSRQRCELLAQHAAFQRIVEPLYAQVRDLLATVAPLEALSAASTTGPAADNEAGGRDQLTALSNALARLEQAEQEGRSYPHIALAMRDQRDLLEQQLQHIAAEQRQLQEAERLCESLQFARAEPLLRELQTASHPTVEQRATKLLEEIAHVQQRFGTAMARGLSQEQQPATAVISYREAYKEWPDGPAVVDRLVDALVQAGEQALAHNEDDEALGYFQDALQLRPDHERALAGSRRPQLSKRIAADLLRIQTMLRQLHAHGDVQPTDIEDWIDRIRELREEAAENPGMVQQLTLAEERARQQRQAWETYAEMRSRSEHLRDEGRWEEAVALLTQATDTLQLPHLDQPPRVMWDLDRWRESLQTITSTEEQMRRLLEEVEQDYRQVPTQGNAATLSDLFNLLDTMDDKIQIAIEYARRAGGPLSTNLQAMRQRAIAQRRSLDAVKRILEFDRVPERLAATRDARQRLGEDPVLQQLEQQLVAKQQSVIAELRRNADTAHTRGSIRDELKVISELRELQPTDPETEERYQQLEARQRLDEQLRQAEQGAGGTSSTVTSTRDALRSAIDLFIAPEWRSIVPFDVRQMVTELTELADAQDKTAIADDGPWAQAQSLLQRLRSVDHWTADRTVYLAGRWLNIAREVAVNGLIATLSELGEVLRAYETAVNYRRATPTSDQSFRYVVDAQEKLITGLKQTATKQLSRAHEMLDQGEPAVALDHLNRLFEQFYTPIEQSFPGLIARIDEDGTLSKHRDEAVVLRARAEHLAGLAERANALLNQAQQSNAHQAFPEAAQALAALPDLSELPHLAQRVVDLRTQQIEGQRKQTEGQFSREINVLYIDLAAARTLDDFASLKQQLDHMKTAFDWSMLDDNARERYEQIWSRIQEQGTALASVQRWEQDADQALANNDLLGAQEALERARNAARDAERRSQLQRKLDQVGEQLVNQAKRDELFNTGFELFESGSYEEARRALVQVNSLNARLKATGNVETQTAALLDAARAGLLLREAQLIWDEGRGLERGATKLDLAQRMIAASPQFAPLLNEIQFYRQRIAERLDQIAAELEAAHVALSTDDLAAARRTLLNASSLDADHRELRTLTEEAQRRIDEQQRLLGVRKLVQQIEQMRDKGDVEGALELVDGALTKDSGNVELQILKVELSTGLEASQALRAAQELVFKGDFRKAQERIRFATTAQANPTQLKDVQRLLDDARSSYLAARIYPIRELVRAKRFAEALRRTQDELAKEHLSDDLHAELRELEGTIARRWPEHALDESQMRLGRTLVMVEDYVTVEKTLQTVLDRLTPLDSFQHGPQITDQLRQTTRGRLNYRLDLISLALHYHLSSVRGETQPLAELADDLTQRRLAEAPQQLDVALVWAEQVAEEASTQQLTALKSRAERMKTTLLGKIAEQREEQRRVELSRLLNPVHTLRSASPDGRSPEQIHAELLNAAALVEQARRSYEDDDSALKTLAEQLADDIHNLETDRALLQECVRQIKAYPAEYQQLNDLLVELNQGPHSRYVADRTKQLRTIIEALLEAEQHRSNLDWPEAVTAYDHAIAVDSDLGLRQRLRDEIDDVRDRATERAIGEITKLFDSDEPDLVMINTQLDQLLNTDWVVKDVRIQQLRSQRDVLASIERVQQIISEPDGDLDAAQETLSQARQQPQSFHWTQQIEQWEHLVQALEACRNGMPQKAARHLDALRPTSKMRQAVDSVEKAIVRLRADQEQQQVREVVAVVRASLTHDALPQAKEKLEQVASIASDRYPELDGAREAVTLRARTLEQVDAKLATAREQSRDRDFVAAIETLTHARMLARHYPNVGTAIHDVQRLVAQEAQRLADQHQFAEALRLIQLALALAGNEELASEQARIASLRQNDQNEAKQEALRVLARWDRERARSLSERMAAQGYEGEELDSLRSFVATGEATIKSLCAAMEAGWQALDDGVPDQDAAAWIHYATAHTAFEAAAQIEPMLDEAQVWSAFAEQMVEGIRLAVKAGMDADAYHQAEIAFGTARQWLQPAPNEELTSIFAGRRALLDRRRRGIYNAKVLAESAFTMRGLARNVAGAEDKAQAKEAVNAIQSLRAGRNQLIALCHVYASTPNDFMLDPGERSDG